MKVEPLANCTCHVRIIAPALGLGDKHQIGGGGTTRGRQGTNTHDVKRRS